jgi:mannose-6-phosphate isomerase-like protein (cupin superfamily)
MRAALIAVLLLASTPGFAQIRATPPGGFKYMSRGEIDKAVSIPEPGRAYGATFMNDHENYYIEFVKRVDHGNMVERHPHWVDQVTILSGEGVLTYGGNITNPNTAPTGEVRGGTQVGGMTKNLHPGDFVLIPAGMAHTFAAAPGKSLTYVVAKARS